MTVPIGVLFVGDSEVDARAVDRALRAGGYLPSVNRTGRGDLELALGRDHVEVAIVDFDGAGAEDLLKLLGTPSRDLPCIAIGSSPGMEHAARAMRAGAHDYLVKTDLGFLALAVEREVRESKERSRRVQAERQVAAGTERLLIETRAQARSFKALHEVAIVSGGFMEPAALARTTVEGARKLIGADAVALYTWDVSRGRLVRQYVSADHADAESATGVGIAELAFRSGAPIELVGMALCVVAPSLAARGITNVCAVPLLSGERVVGALVAGTLNRRVIEAQSIEALRLLGAQAGPSVEAGRLGAERDVMVHRLEALHRIAVAAGSVVDPAELSALAAAQARDLTGAWSAALLWLQPDGSLLSLHDNHPVTLLTTERLARSEGATGLAMDSGDPVVIDDYKHWESASEWAVKGGIASLIAVPLLVRDVALGCLVVRARTQGHFRDDHVRILSLLAAQVGPSLEGARQARERHEQARIFRALHEIAVAASGVLDPVQLSGLAVGHACELLGCDGAVVFSWDPQAALLRPLAESESTSSEPPCRSGEGAVGLAFESGEPVVIDDYALFEKAMPNSAARGMVSAAAVPLLVDDRAVGALGVWTYHPRRFTDADLQVMRLFSAQLAPALEASRQASERDLQAHAFRELHELAVAAGGVLEPAALAEMATAKACDLLGAQSSVLVRFELATGTLEALADNHPELGGEPRDTEAIGATGIAFRQRAAVSIEDYAGWEHAMPSAVTRGVRSVLAVPILVQDVAIGCLAVRWTERREISTQDARLLGLLAAEVGPSIEAARIAEEREVRARAFAALHDLAVAVGGVLDPGALAGLATDHARDLLDADSSTLVWWDGAAGSFAVLAENHPNLSELAGYEPRKAGVVEVAFKRGEPVAIADYKASPLSVKWARDLGIASVLIAPLLVDGRPVGCLGVRTNTIRNFSSADIQLLVLLAAQVAPAIHAARLHHNLRESEQSFRAIFEEAPVFIARHDLGGRILKMNQTGLQMFGYTEKDLGHLSAGALLADPLDEDSGLADLRSGRSDRYRLDRRYRRKDGTLFWGSTTLSLVRDEDGRPDCYYSIIEDVDDRRRAADSLQHQADTFRALHELGLAASGILEPAALAAIASETARDLLAVDSAGVLWLDDSGEALRVLADTRPDIPAGITIPFGGAGADALRRGEALVLDDYPSWEGANPGAVARGVLSAVIVPLHVRDRVIGTLGVQSVTRRSFPGTDVELLSLIAAAIGPAIEAARLHADLVHSESRIRAIFRTAPMTIGRIDRAGVMVEMNPVLETMTGYSLEEVIGRHFEALPWADGGVIEESDRDDLATGSRERVQYEKSLIRKDGSRFWAEITVSSVRRPDGEIEFFYVMVTDINERKVAENALRGSEVLKGSIVNSALDCIVAADAAGRILEFNPAAERLFGRTREEVLGLDALDLILAERVRELHRVNFARSMLDNEKRESANRIETIGVRADGSEIPIEISASRVEQDGHVIISASIRDLSERNQAIIATRESEAKSRFLASMSHELRTPLNSILGFAQLLDSASPGPLTERQKRYVGHIESSGRHLLALITDVLDLSKVAAGQMEVDLADVELNPLAEEALERIAPLADVGQVVLVLDPTPALWVRADRRRLLQVLLNLLSNAIKFTPPGGIVRVSPAKSGAEVELSVIDTGIGIAEDRREWIFEEFTQVQVGALDRNEGTGLGLALSRRLLTLMDGSIRVQSEAGRGSVFTVTLPGIGKRREGVQPPAPAEGEAPRVVRS